MNPYLEFDEEKNPYLEGLGLPSEKRGLAEIAKKAEETFLPIAKGAYDTITNLITGKDGEYANVPPFQYDVTKHPEFGLAEKSRKIKEELGTKGEVIKSGKPSLWKEKPPLFEANIPVLGRTTPKSLTPFLGTLEKRITGEEEWLSPGTVMEPAAEIVQMFLGSKLLGAAGKAVKWAWMKRLPKGEIRPIEPRLELPAPSNIIEGEIVREPTKQLPFPTQAKQLPPPLKGGPPEIYLKSQQGFTPAFYDEVSGKWVTPLEPSPTKQLGYQGFTMKEPPPPPPRTILRSEKRGEGFIIKPPGGEQQRLPLTETQKMQAPVVTAKGETVGVRPTIPPIPEPKPIEVAKQAEVKGEVSKPMTTLEAYAKGETLTKEQAIATWEEYKGNVAKSMPEDPQEASNIGFDNQLLRETVEGFLKVGKMEALTPDQIDKQLYGVSKKVVKPEVKVGGITNIEQINKELGITEARLPLEERAGLLERAGYPKEAEKLRGLPSPTRKGETLLPGMKVGLEQPKAEAVTPTLGGTPLGEAARKVIQKKVQPEIFGERQVPDILSWVRKKGGIKSKGVSIDTQALTQKESGLRGIVTKGGRGADELAQEWEWETGQKLTTDEFSERLNNAVMGGEKGPKITEAFIKKAEEQHFKELASFFDEMGKEGVEISTKPSMPKRSGVQKGLDLDSGEYGLLEGEEKKGLLDSLGILKSEKGQVEIPKEVIESLSEGKKFGKETAMGLYKEIGSPYRVFEFDKTGNGTKIWNLTDNADRQGSVFHKKFIDATQKNVKIAPDTEASMRIGDLLDQYESWEHIPKWEQDKLNPEEAHAFKYMREGWNKMADVLMEKGLLAPTRKIKSYMFRIFPKDEIYKAWRDEFEALNVIRAAAGPEYKQSADFKDRFEKLAKSISEYEKTGTILYDYVPKSLTAPFLKERTGAQGYSFDAVNAWTTYEYYYKRKLFDEPAIKESLKLMQQMEPKFKGYTRQYLRRFLGMEKPDELKRAEMVLTNLEWLKDFAFSPKNAVVNFTQHSMTIAEIGPKWTGEGAYFALTSEGKAIFEASGHKADVPNLRWGTEARNIPDSVKRSAGYLFDKVELANRMVSYLGAYKKVISEGKSPEEAIKYGDEVVRKTQGIYGRTGSPMGQMSRGGSIGLQYITTPIKMGETFIDWALHDKIKLLTYLGLVTATSETLKELGVDMSNVLGIGIDNRELLKGMVHLFKGETSSALRHTKMGLPFIPFINPAGTQGSGIFPSGFFPAIETMQDVLKLEWEKWIPLQAKRMIEGGKALYEGEYKVPVTGEKGYPIRNLRTGELKTTLSLPQLLSRTFLAQPRKETEQWKALKEEAMIEKDKKTKLQDIGKAIIGKNKEKLNKLLKSEGVVSNEEINYVVGLEWKKRNLTPLARKELQLWMSKNGLPFRITVGESHKLE